MSEYYKIPPKENAQFVAHMEDILVVYKLPYNPDVPVICMDESPKQLIEEVYQSLPTKEGQVKKIDPEYKRNGVINIFMAVEPLGGKRYVKATEHRRKTDWALFMKDLSELYSDASKIIIVMDNLNIHTIGSFYEAFPAAEARELSTKFEFHYTPKHGSWLNIAESELSVLVRQCLSRRIPTLLEIQRLITIWQNNRNNKYSKVNWHFSIDDARTKLKSLYPKFE